MAGSPTGDGGWALARDGETSGAAETVGGVSFGSSTVVTTGAAPDFGMELATGLLGAAIGEGAAAAGAGIVPGMACIGIVPAGSSGERI